MAKATQDLKSLRRVVDLMGAARAGSRHLDYQVAVACGFIADKGLEILARAVGGEVSAIEAVAVDDAVPPLTTSLDAALPWEEIVACRREGGRLTGRWHADALARLSPSGPAITVTACGGTEALARRKAAAAARLYELCGKRREPTNPRVRNALGALDLFLPVAEGG